MIENLRVLVIGDLMLDSYIYIKVDRLSHEAPVPLGKIEKKKKEVLGGAANVAANFKALGANEVGLVTQCSTYARGMLAEKGIVHIPLSSDLLETDTKKTRYIDDRTGYHLLRVDEDGFFLAGELPTARIEEFNPDIFFLADYNHGRCQGWMIDEIRTHYPDALIGFSSRNPGHTFKNFDWLFQNEEEITAQSKAQRCINISVEKLIEKLKIRDGVLMTRAERGIMVYYYPTPKKSWYEMAKAINSNIVDATGAGDTAAATFMLVTAMGQSPIDAMILANKKAGEVCMKLGTVTPSKLML